MYKGKWGEGRSRNKGGNRERNCERNREVSKVIWRKGNKERGKKRQSES